MVAREERLERCVAERLTLAGYRLGTVAGLASCRIKEAVDLARKWHKVEATGCAKQGADGVRIRDARQLDDDPVGPLRLHERLCDAGAVDATLNDVADRGEIGSGSADAVNWLHLILNA